MKISVEYKDQSYTSNLLKIVAVNYSGDFVIKVKFSDETEKNIDFKPFLQKALHPTIKKYLNEKLFLQFKLIDGNINWNDYELIFPLKDLYHGEIG